MLKNVPNQWKAEIIDAVGINEFTDMYIQAIRQFVCEDLFTTEIQQAKFDDVLEKSELDTIIAKLMTFVDQNEEDLKKLTISQQILLCRAILNDIDVSKIDFKKINYESLDNEIEATAKGRKQLANLVHGFISKDTNLVKTACKKLDITYKELGEAIGYKPDTVNSVASTGKISESMKRAIEMYLENAQLKEELKNYTTLKEVLKNLIK